MNKFLSSFVGLCMGIVLFAPVNALAASFGVSPPWIENDNIKAGSSFDYTINLSASDLSDNMTVHSQFEGDLEIEQWLTIQNKESLVMTTKQGIVPMYVHVKVPKNAKIGKYEGNLKLSLSPKNAAKDGINVLLGSSIVIKLNVIDHDVTDYWVQSVSVDSIVEGQPIDLQMAIQNLGNTSIDSVMTKVSIVNMKTNTEVASGSADTLGLPVQPNTKVNASLSFLAPDLKPGDYWLDVEAFKDNKSTYKNRLFLNVESTAISNSLKTTVLVTEENALVKPVASEVVGKNGRQGADVKTSVRVRAPYTDKLIVLGVVLLFVLTVLVAKIYANSRKGRR